jgi:hypothetical protein
MQRRLLPANLVSFYLSRAAVQLLRLYPHPYPYA